MAAPEFIETVDEDGLTPLHMAVIQGNLNLVNYLLANKANVNALDSEGHSVVHWATGENLKHIFTCSTHQLVLQSVEKLKFYGWCS